MPVRASPRLIVRMLAVLIGPTRVCARPRWLASSPKIELH